VAQRQRLAAMEAQESGTGSPPAPVQCVARLTVGFPGYRGQGVWGEAFHVRVLGNGEVRITITIDYSALNTERRCITKQRRG